MIVIILLVGLVIRLIGINQSFWLDEAAQVIESARPLAQQLAIAGDFQPPLFHILLHFWMRAGVSESWIRLLPILMGITTIAVFYLLVKKVTNHKVALLAAILLAYNPFHVWYSQEVRPYSLSVLVALASTYFLLTRHWKWYVLSTIAAVYSMYVLPFLFIGHGLYLFVYQRQLLRKWFWCMMATTLGFLPWVPFFWGQLRGGGGLVHILPGWSEAVSTPLYKAIPLVFAKFLLGRISIADKFVYGVILLIAALICIYLLYLAQRRLAKLTFGLLVMTGGAFLSAFGVSWFIPILAPQRVLYLLPLLLIPISIGLTKSRLRWILILSIIAIQTYSLMQYWTNPQAQREQWREATAYVEDHRSARSIVLFVFPDSFAPWQWYNHHLVQGYGVAPNFVVNQSDLTAKQAQINQSDRIFLFHYLTDLTDVNELTVRYLEHNGYMETDKHDFPGVGFVSTYERAVAYN